MYKIDWYGTDSGLDPMTQLYTAKGSQGFGAGKNVIENLFVDT